MEDSNNTFTTKKEFSQWIMSNSDPILTDLLGKLDPEEFDKLYDSYENHMDMNGDFGITNFLSVLGQSIPSFIKLAQDLNRINEGKDKRDFVIENVLLLSRLIDNGKSGTEDNINKTTEGFDGLSGNKNDLQDEVVRPQVDTALETLVELWKKFNH